MPEGTTSGITSAAGPSIGSLAVAEPKSGENSEDKIKAKAAACKILPDPQIVAKDIRDQLKGADFGIALKSKISTTMKEVEALLKVSMLCQCKTFTSYLVKPNYLF